MRITTVLAFVASAAAVDLRHYTGFNCGGGFAGCGGLPPGTCCNTPDFRNGSPSVAVVFTSPNTNLLGYQAVRDNPNWCGFAAFQRNSGQFSFVCLSYDPFGAGTFAGTAYFPQGRKRAEPKCTGYSNINHIVLDDGTRYGLEGVDETGIKEWYQFLRNGSTVADLPESYKRLEQDKKGVEGRRKEMQGRGIGA
ncbi:hypothetical protein P154DRAFT_594450 [Amniculicola lignicola CBS 123094]|uniref:Uncharacterized protein n=1 Tax=Amniculicola lignicola CBS 123094 TaxID=1392246 RepID=A0A6A5WJW7_9PLEO|nr:hypothetical protein P154DRAFT_594450 [Amniculicola lignicola CBS 123094]